MSLYEENAHLIRVTADIAVLDERIRRLLADIEDISDTRGISIALKRLFVLQEYRYVLLEDRNMVVRRIAALSTYERRAYARGSTAETLAIRSASTGR